MWHLGDPFLVELINAVEAGATSPTLTLLVGGVLLTGHIISQQEWSAATRNEARVFPVDPRKTIEQVLTTLDNTTGSSPPGFALLADVQFVGQVGMTLSYMRVPLAAIDGVSVGRP